MAIAPGRRRRRPPTAETIERRIRDYIARHRLIEPGEAVLLAVSGGADSLCLLHALARLAPALGCRLEVAHLDHGLRGDEAAADSAFVAAEAARLGLAFHAGRADVPARARAERLSLEAAARRARYAFLREIAVRVGAARVATGHTASDQAETVLLNLLRGAGTAGLAGMPPARPLARGVTLIRPLLVLTRADTEAYSAALGLAPRRDRSNEDLAHRRNRIRHRLLPLLRALNPRVEAALNRTAAALRLDEDALTALAAAVPLQPADNGLAVPLDDLRRLPPAVQMRVLRRAYAALGAPAELGAVHRSAWLRALAPGFSGRIELPGGLLWSVEHGTGYFRRAGAQLQAPAPVALPLDGTPVAFGPWRLAAWPVEAPDFTAGPDVAHLDADRLPGPLIVRARRPGDRFRPLGMATEKRLQDFLVDARVPRAARDTLPLVTSGDAIVWVAGHRPDERFKVTPATQRVLRLEVTRADDR